MPKKNPLQLSFWAAEESELWNVMIEFIVNGYMDGAALGVNMLPAEMRILVDWDVVNDAALEFAARYRYTWIKDLTATTRAHVQRAIVDWINEGAPLNVLETRLQEWFKPVRAARIAATEVTRIYARANADAWLSTGYIRQGKWHTVMDERVCPICGPLEGTVVDLADPAQLPPERSHIGCRCSITPIVDVEALNKLTERILGL